MPPKQPIEPMIRINHTGYGIRVATMVQVVVLLVPIIGAWYNLTAKQNYIVSEIERNARAVDSQIQSLAALMERNRVERLGDIKDLRVTTSDLNSDLARVQEQIKNLQLLLGDIRKNSGLDNDRFPESTIQ